MAYRPSALNSVVCANTSDRKTLGPFYLQTVVGNALALTLGAGISQVLMAGSVLLVARQVGAERFGVYAAAFNTAVLASILFNLGLDTWLLRSGARAPQQLGSLLGVAIAIKLFVGVLWLGGMVTILPCLNPGIFQPQLVWVSALVIWVESLYIVGLSAFKAMLRNQVTALVLVGSRGGLLLLTILLALVDVREAMPYAWARLAIALASVLITASFLPVKLKRPLLAHVTQAGRESLPFALSDLFTSIYVQADTTIAALTLTPEAVGLYAPASSLIYALSVIPSSWYSVLIPALIRALERRRMSIKKLFGLSIVSLSGIGIALWVGLLCVADLLPSYLLGNSYEETGSLLAILSPLLFLKSYSFALAAILVAVGWQSRRMYVQAIAAFTNVVLNLAVIYKFGITGVAIVYVVSEFLLTIGYLALVFRWLQRSELSSEAG